MEELLVDCEGSEEDSHIMKVKVICLESSQNYTGGKVLSRSYLEEVKSMATKYDLKLHLDGARVLNSCIHLGVEPSVYCE